MDRPAGPDGGAAVRLLGAGVRISVHGDSEFRSQELFAWLRTQGYAALLGISGRLWVYDTTDPAEIGQPLEARVTALPPQTEQGRKRQQRTSPITYLAQVYVGVNQAKLL